MNAQVYALLRTVSPTYHLELPAGVTEGIVYQLAQAGDVVYESGAAVAERYTYQVTVFQNQYNGGVIKDVISALRGGGWAVASRMQMVQQDGTAKYYQHVITIQKMELI